MNGITLSMDFFDRKAPRTLALHSARGDTTNDLVERRMTQAIPRMTNLFLQLGLDASPEAIADFIGEHQLPADVHIADAPYWSDAQRQFICEKLRADGPWSLIVDQLNESLHERAVKEQMAGDD